MSSPFRVALVAALAIGCHGAVAQTAVPPVLTVQRAAPQLVAFAGSQSNFQNLVTGLAQGTPVQLLTVLPDGSTQVVTFTPAAPVPPDQIAQALEASRQQLIGLGIANPTAEQIARSLTGGVVPTVLGGSQVTGTLNPQNPPSPAAQIQANAAAGSTAVTPATPAVSVQVLPPVAPAATSASPRFNTSDSAIPAGATSRSPAVSTSATPAAQPATVTPGAPPAAPTTESPAKLPARAPAHR